jgi:hypothetical protein
LRQFQEQRNGDRARLRNALVLAVVLCAFPALILGALDWFMTSARKQAAAGPGIFAAQSSPAVVASLGTPITPGWPIGGWAHSRHAEGEARLTIRLSGPKGQGRLMEIAQQHAKIWSACRLEFIAPDGQRIELKPSSVGDCTH